MTVFVTTDTELGWDCVTGVYDSLEAYNEQMQEYGEPPIQSWDEIEAPTHVDKMTVTTNKINKKEEEV